MSTFWITVSTLAIGTVLTFIANVIINKLQKVKLLLHYTVAESGLFPINGIPGKFYNIKIKNDGNERIDDIDTIITFPNGKIKEAQVKLHKPVSFEQTTDQINFNVKYLNPTDEIDCVITIEEGVQESKPIIKACGKGATASCKTVVEKKSKWGLIILSGEIGLLIGLIVSGNFLNTSSMSNETLGKPEKIENIFSVLNKAQLPHLFPQIIKINENISYVGTAFFITHSYLKDSCNEERYINALKGLAKIDDIASSSKGTIYYLIYKIEDKEKNDNVAKEYLQKCQTETPLMYQSFIEQDQYYNLDSLQSWMIKNNF